MGSGMDGAAHVPDSDGNPNVFDVKRNDDGKLWLNNDWKNPDNRWKLDNRIVFRLRYSLTKADETYHITASTVFSLANRALEIFESSKPNEQRQLLGYLVQNCELDGKKLAFTLASPFNLILETSHQPIGLPVWVHEFVE